MRSALGGPAAHRSVSFSILWSLGTTREQAQNLGVREDNGKFTVLLSSVRDFSLAEL